MSGTLQFKYNQRKSNDPYHIYYDVNIINSDPVNNSYAPLSFINFRSSTYINRPENYFLSIVKFNLDTPRVLPVWRPELCTGQIVSTLLTNYQFGMYLNASGTVLWENVHLTEIENAQLNPSPLPLNNSSLGNPYYWYYSYDTVIRILNTNLAAFWAEVRAMGAPYSGLTPTPPYFDFDTSSMNIILYGVDVFQTNGGGVGLYFCVNNPLMEMLSTMSFQRKDIAPGNASNTGTGLESLQAYIFTPVPSYVSGANPPNTPMCRSYITPIPYWCPIESVIFSTSVMPIMATNVSEPVSYGTVNTPTTNGSNNDNVSTIVSNFSVSISASNNFSPSLLYVPSAEYRLFDMLHADNLNQLGLNVSWRDKWGNFYPLLLNNNCGASMLILFRRKDYSGEKDLHFV